jgi:hypothetical protein
MSEEQNQPQSTFDWMNDDATFEVTEGIKYDPDHDYTFEITEIKGISGHTSEGKEYRALKITFRDTEQNGTINKAFFYGKITKNNDKPDKSNPLVQFAESLGFRPEIGSNIHPKMFLRVGLKFTARVTPQKDKQGKETNFNEIVFATVKPIGKTPQKKIVHDPDMVAKWQTAINDGKYGSKEVYMAELAKGRVQEIPAFLDACSDGTIKF